MTCSPSWRTNSYRRGFIYQLSIITLLIKN